MKNAVLDAMMTNVSRRRVIALKAARLVMKVVTVHM